MIRRIFFALLWGFAFFVGASLILVLGFLSAGIYNEITDGPGRITFSQLWKFTPLAGAALGLILGLLGRLPGTRLRVIPQ